MHGVCWVYLFSYYYLLFSVNNWLLHWIFAHVEVGACAVTALLPSSPSVTPKRGVEGIQEERVNVDRCLKGLFKNSVRVYLGGKKVVILDFCLNSLEFLLNKSIINL